MTTTSEGQPVEAKENEGFFHRLFNRSNRWRTIAILTLILLIGMVIYASSAAFTSASVNPTNVTSAGTLTQSNSAANAAIFTAANLIPGQSASGTVTIKNTGSAKGAFSLDSSSLTDTPGANGGKLSDVLTLKIVDTTTSTTVYNGAYNAMPTISLGTWAAGESHAYSFTVTFPEGGTPPSGTTGDNAYQGSSTSITYTWNAVATT